MALHGHEKKKRVPQSGLGRGSQSGLGRSTAVRKKKKK